MEGGRPIIYGDCYRVILRSLCFGVVWVFSESGCLWEAASDDEVENGKIFQ